MLGDKKANATIPVKDLKVAKRFYEGTLELKPAPNEQQQVVVYPTSGSTIFVYESQYAGTNKATAITWTVGPDVERIAKALKAKGVVFEHYDFPNTKLEGDVHVMGRMKMAWFKDPDGNIHNIVSG